MSSPLNVIFTSSEILGVKTNLPHKAASSAVWGRVNHWVETSLVYIDGSGYGINIFTAAKLRKSNETRCQKNGFGVK